MRRSSKLIALLGLSATLFALPARADVKAGVDAWSRGDYATAVNEWRDAAAAGDADAQFNLAQAYKLGHGVPQDLLKAEELFGRAAAQGHLQASDNYGLLLFQRGAREQAMPYIRASADRGEPRAQYLLGIAHFNGDLAPKDWVRAYALVSLAQQAGLEQAKTALAQMDQYIPLDQRQRAATLAPNIAALAQGNRKRQLAASDLGVPAAAPRGVEPDSPRTAGADYARPMASAPLASTAKPDRVARPQATPAPQNGPWRVQLGAFGVAANADAAWARLRSRPEVAGHPRIDAKAGAMIRLMAGGFVSQDAAQSACKRLAAAGVACLAVRN